MALFKMLVKRQLQPELMDGPGLNSIEHAQALHGLRRLNIVSRAHHQLWRAIVEHTGVKSGGQLRILDVASGGGDIAMGIWTLARKGGVKLQILGLDSSPTACVEASQRCQFAGKSIAFSCTDVTKESLPRQFDVVMSSLFLHHLAWEEAAALIRNMSTAGKLLIMSDLRRSAFGYAVAQMACRVVTRSRIVRHDGPRSVANAFTLSEMGELCHAAGLTGAIVRRKWPWRMIVIRCGAQ